MQTIMLCTEGVFSTAVRCSPCGRHSPARPPRPLHSSEPRLVGGIAPGTRDHPGAVARAHVVLEAVDDFVDLRGSTIRRARRQQRLQRLDAERRVGGRMLVVVVVIVAHGMAPWDATAGDRRETLAAICHRDAGNNRTNRGSARACSAFREFEFVGRLLLVTVDQVR